MENNEKYDTKSNAKQAMKELFGVSFGGDTHEEKKEHTAPVKATSGSKASAGKDAPVISEIKTDPPTTIGEGTVIVGTISSKGPVEIKGILKGDITTTNRVKISGKVQGNITAGSVILNGCKVKGNIISSSSVNVDSDSVIAGDLNGNDITIDGKVKGNVAAKNVTSLSENAVVVGDINATRFNMSEGTRLFGNVKLSCSGTISENDFEKELQF